MLLWSFISSHTIFTGHQIEIWLLFVDETKLKRNLSERNLLASHPEPKIAKLHYSEVPKWYSGGMAHQPQDIHGFCFQLHFKQLLKRRFSKWKLSFLYFTAVVAFSSILCPQNHAIEAFLLQDEFESQNKTKIFG